MVTDKEFLESAKSAPIFYGRVALKKEEFLGEKFEETLALEIAHMTYDLRELRAHLLTTMQHDS